MQMASRFVTFPARIVVYVAGSRKQQTAGASRKNALKQGLLASVGVSGASRQAKRAAHGGSGTAACSGLSLRAVGRQLCISEGSVRRFAFGAA